MLVNTFYLRSFVMEHSITELNISCNLSETFNDNRYRRQAHTRTHAQIITNLLNNVSLIN